LFSSGEKVKSKPMYYSDSDWCGDGVDRRITSGYLFKYLGIPIAWYSKKQSVVALSIYEA
jgi:hypothetical protein